jgi:mannitol PTS system EIIA component
MSNVLEIDQIKAQGTAHTKEEAIREAADILIGAGAVTAEYIDFMKAREVLTSTYMGNFLAIPHGTNEGKETILESALSFVRYSTPLDWDGHEVRFVVGIAGKDGGHMEILSKIAILFSETDDVQRLLDAPDRDALFAILSEVND